MRQSENPGWRIDYLSLMKGSPMDADHYARLAYDAYRKSLPVLQFRGPNYMGISTPEWDQLCELNP